MAEGRKDRQAHRVFGGFGDAPTIEVDIPAPGPIVWPDEEPEAVPAAPAESPELVPA